MSYMNVVRTHSQNNRFEYNHKKLFKQVRKAMKKQGNEREAALKEILKSAYREEAARYEPMCQKLGLDLHDMAPGAAYTLGQQLKNMANPATFLEQLAQIVGAMAEDIDMYYKADDMLGLSLNEAKELVDYQIGTYTIRDQAMYPIEKHGISKAYEDLEYLGKDDNGEIVKYADGTDAHQDNLKIAYMRKEEFKREISEMNFFKRWWYRAEVREKRSYIANVESILNLAEFTDDIRAEVEQEATQPAAFKRQHKLAHAYLDNKYKSTEPSNDDIVENQRNADKAVDPQSFLKKGYIPNIFNLEQEKAAAEQLEKDLKNEVFIKYNPKYTLAYEVFTDNLNRLNEMMRVNEESRADNLKMYSEIYKAQDEAWNEKHPDYVAPDAPKEQVQFADEFKENANEGVADKINEAPQASKQIEK